MYQIKNISLVFLKRVPVLMLLSRDLCVLMAKKAVSSWIVWWMAQPLLTVTALVGCLAIALSAPPAFSSSVGIWTQTRVTIFIRWAISGCLMRWSVASWDVFTHSDRYKCVGTVFQCRDCPCAACCDLLGECKFVSRIRVRWVNQTPKSRFGGALIFCFCIIIEQVSFTKNISKRMYTYILVSAFVAQPISIKLPCISYGDSQVSTEEPIVTILRDNILLNSQLKLSCMVVAVHVRKFDTSHWTAWED